MIRDKDNISEMKKDFENAFSHYWYDKKSLSEKLRDSMSEEEKICSDFFEALNDLEMLDKLYEIDGGGLK